MPIHSIHLFNSIHSIYKKEKVVLIKNNRDEQVRGSNLVGFLGIYILFTMHRTGLMKFTR